MKRKLHINEQLLIDLLVNKDRSAFEFLQDSYSPILHGHLIDIIADKDIAEDVLKKAFITAYFTISDFKGRKSKLLIWMLDVALRMTFETMRIIEKWPTVSQLKAASFGLCTVLDTMDAESKRIIHLMYDKGYSKAKIATLLNLPIYRVDELLQTGLEQLQQYLNTCNWKPL